MGPATLPAAIAGIAISLHLLACGAADPRQTRCDRCDADCTAENPAAVVDAGSGVAVRSMPSRGGDARKRRCRGAAGRDRCLSFDRRFADNAAAIASTGTHA
jgi:hypothetical protein